MVVFRCTQKLRKRLGQTTAVSPIPVSDTILGDWYCNLVHFGRLQTILCVSARTLLPVLIPARDARAFPERLSAELEPLLLELGIEATAVHEELHKMRAYAVGPTASRVILGSMNDFVKMADYYLVIQQPPWPLAKVTRVLMEAPCSPIHMLAPQEATRRAFAQHAQP